MSAVERFNVAMMRERALSEDEFSKLWRAAYRETHSMSPVDIAMRATVAVCILIGLLIAVVTHL